MKLSTGALIISLSIFAALVIGACLYFENWWLLLLLIFGVFSKKSGKEVLV